MLFFWIFFQLLGLLEAYHWDGNIMYDLELQGSSFDSEASAWVQSAYWTSGIKTTTCGGDRIMGGLEVMGGIAGYWERTYTSLPTHNVIYLSIKIYPIDSWDYADNDHFELAFDGVPVIGWTLQGNNMNGETNICGRHYFTDLKPLMMFVTFPHTAGSLVFRMISSLSETSTDESLGFRDIKMDFQQVSNPPASSSFCGVTQGFPLEHSACPCADGKYMTPVDSGICANCDSTCLTCSAAGSSACVTCANGRYKVGNTCPQCNSNCQTCSGSATACQTCPTGWFMVGTTCYPTCNSPLYPEVVNGVTFCRTPCSGSIVMWDGSCNSVCSYSNSYGSYQLTPVTANTFLQCNYPCPTAQYLYWNASCISSCPSPLSNQIYKDRNFCGYSCTTAQYLYWNGSCENSCPWPLSPETQNTVTAYQRKFCWYTCQPNEYLYWNGSCLSTCPAPLTPEVQGTNPTRNFCWYTCPADQYLYWNGSCLNNCPWPLSSEVQGTNPTYKRNFCWYYCQPGEFMYWNGSCLSTCPSPLVSEVQGMNPTRNFCWYTCSTTQHLYWNGSCLDTCPEPLSPEIQLDRKFCWYGCQPNEYLYWNGSCRSTCDSPLDSEIQGTFESRNFCWSPCQGDQYIYWNRSCSSECPSPLAKKIDPNAKFCVNTCGDFPSNYLYSNQSCLSTCLNPLSVRNSPGVQYCVNLCPAGTYLYENQTCLNNCSSPYLKRIEPVDIQYCDRPCSQPNIYWYQNASCLGECKFPYVQFNYSGILQCLPPCKDDFEYFYDYENKCSKRCDSPYKIEFADVIKVCKVGIEITVEEVEKLQETAASIETQGKFTSGGMKAASAINSNNPASALLAGLSSMMQYIRYMKINYPPKVQMLFLVSAGSPISLSFGVKMPSFIEKHLTDEPLSEAFDKYDINSNFVSNLWDFMVSLVLIFLAILVLTILKIITFGLPKLNAVVSRALQMLKWNFPIMMICGSSGDIFFYASLQLRSSPFKNLSSIICCIVSIFMMILVVVLLGIAWKIVSGMHRRLRNPEARETSQWKGFEILYSEYEEKSFFSLAYMFLFVSRGIIFNLTLAILYEYPIVQCIIINVCNIAMICYVLYLRPLKELLALVQLWINEGLVNILSISVFILAILEPTGVHREATRVGVGDVILFVIKTFNTAGLVFMGIGMLLLILSMYRTLKTLREKNIKSPIKMVKALIFGVPEEEKVSPAGPEEFAKRPKIMKPLGTEKMWTREENSSVIGMKEDKSFIHIVSDNSHQILPTNILQTEFQDSKVQVTDLDISQSFFNPQKKISSLKRVYKVRVQGRNDILENSEEEVVKRSNDDEMKLWYSKLRKLKRRLNNNSSKKIDLTIETNNSSSLF